MKDYIDAELADTSKVVLYTNLVGTDDGKSLTEKEMLDHFSKVERIQVAAIVCLLLWPIGFFTGFWVFDGELPYKLQVFLFFWFTCGLFLLLNYTCCTPYGEVRCKRIIKDVRDINQVSGRAMMVVLTIMVQSAIATSVMFFVILR